LAQVTAQGKLSWISKLSLPQMQSFSLLAVLAAWLVVSVQATPVEDDSESSGISNTMARILGRAHAHAHTQPPMRAPVAARPKLGLSKVSNKETHAKVKEIMTKADAPAKLSGYLGWGDAGKPKPGFSTEWKNSGDRAAKSLDANTQVQEKPGTPKQALVVDSSVTSAYSQKLETDMSAQDDFTEWPAMDWSAKAKVAAPKIALKVQKTETHANTYLSSVGWKAEVAPPPQRENPYLENFQNPNKKFLVAAEVKEKRDSKENSYFDGIMPSAGEEISMQN